jgi:two-component system, response regulator PdtaR
MCSSGTQIRDADQAIAILEQRDDIHVIVTDIQMPGSMDGVKLAHAVRDRWPPVAIVVTSGMAATQPILPENSRFVAKPVREREILAAVREMTLPSGPH